MEGAAESCQHILAKTIISWFTVGFVQGEKDSSMHTEKNAKACFPDVLWCHSAELLLLDSPFSQVTRCQQPLAPETSPLMDAETL